MFLHMSCLNKYFDFDFDFDVTSSPGHRVCFVKYAIFVLGSGILSSIVHPIIGHLFPHIVPIRPISFFLLQITNNSVLITQLKVKYALI